MPRYISKQVFLETLTCPAAGWARRHGLLEDDTDDLHVRQGEAIGRLARTRFPDGLLVQGEDLQAAAAQTTSLIEHADIGTLFDVHTLFEPAFLVAPYVTRPDILQRGSGGWHLDEVKMATGDKAEYVDDMAYTAMVIRAWGLEIASASLVILAEDYRPGMPDDRLFQTIAHTDEVLERADEFGELWAWVDERTRPSDTPETELALECKKCPYFQQFVAPDYHHHIFELPRLSQKRFQPLKARGIDRIEDLPTDVELTDQQARVRDSVQSGELDVGPELPAALAEIDWPAFYLDFETIQTAVPLYADTGPFETIPIQYSIHKCTAPAQVEDHREFLADPRADQRRELAEALLRDLESAGSVLTYTGYEKKMVQKLAEQVPDRDAPLLALIDRMVDLHKIIKDHVCHPDFHGSTSIKKTLPVLVPDMSYAGLEIGEGGDAMAQYTYLVWGDYDDHDASKILAHLRTYCEQDTLAMVKLHERLAELVSG